LCLIQRYRATRVDIVPPIVLALAKQPIVDDYDLPADELMRFVSHRVAPYKKIRIVEFIDEIPNPPSGKNLRRVLVERDRAAVAGI
jgi:acyl-coenzyme A synthetase/AMP-(fatty) acid ligase